MDIPLGLVLSGSGLLPGLTLAPMTGLELSAKQPHPIPAQHAPSISTSISISAGLRGKSHSSGQVGPFLGPFPKLLSTSVSSQSHNLPLTFILKQIFFILVQSFAISNKLFAYFTIYSSL